MIQQYYCHSVLCHLALHHRGNDTPPRFVVYSQRRFNGFGWQTHLQLLGAAQTQQAPAIAQNRLGCGNAGFEAVADLYAAS